jgi:tetratricopeptide (TPR) repeat protein
VAHSSSPARADGATAAQYLREAQQYYSEGQYFKTARYAFAAEEQDPTVKAEAYSWITLGLGQAGLYNSAAYFFIRTLQSGNKTAIRRILPQTSEFLFRLGPDLIRGYLIRHTSYDDYGPIARSAYLFALGKDALMTGDAQRAVGYLSAVRTDSQLWPFALEMRGSAHAILGKNEEAIADFQACQKKAEDIPNGAEGARYHAQMVGEALDLQARCYANEARTLYQMENFEEADRTYDKVPKASLVWPEVLFEQAWNSFAKAEYNRTLGKLVSYKSPALKFVFNTEIDVLRAQSFLALCLYGDANDVINEFNARYAKVGEEVKKFVEANQRDLPLFYEAGKRALQGTLYTNEGLYEMANQFVRGPYFQNLVASENDVERERAAISRFSLSQPGVEKRGGGFPGFLNEALNWRLKTIKLLGGIFVKNSYLDYHSALIADFEKMAFIKLEMLKRSKEELLHHASVASDDRLRGNVIPSRRDDQMFWTFNGEFWNDELGDYVFGLESECKDNGVPSNI